MRKKKIITGIVACLLAVATAMLGACGDLSFLKHSHTFESRWTSDETGHWHAATCDDTDKQKDYASHIWDQGVVVGDNIVYTCTVCGYTRTETADEHEHSFSPSWNHDEENHWHPATCGHEDAKSDIAPHVWDDGVFVVQPTKDVEGIVKFTCTVCEYEKEENIGLLKDQITVQFIDYDGSIYDAQVLDVDPEHGATATRPQDPMRENHRFIRWDGSLEGLWEDTVLHAVYIKQYTVFFFDYNADVLKECTVDEGGDAEPPQDPIREGYAFSGWNGTYSNVTSDEQVVAEYNINFYKVKFYMPNGSLIEEQNVKYGFMPQEPAVQEIYIDWRQMKGLRFTGWDKPLSAATGECEYHAQYLEEVTEPIIAVDAEAYKQQTQEGVGASKEFNIGIYLLGDLSIYGLNLEIGYDIDLSLDDKAVEPMQAFAGTQVGSHVDNFKHSCNFTWTSLSAAITVSKRAQILTLHFHFSDSRPEVGDHTITIGQSSYIINEKLEKVKPIIVSDCITVI